MNTEAHKRPDIGFFAKLDWAVAGSPPNASEPRDVGLLGRKTKGEVVLAYRLRAALERLNPALPSEAITSAVDGVLCERLLVLWRKYRISNEFLFE